MPPFRGTGSPSALLLTLAFAAGACNSDETLRSAVDDSDDTDDTDEPDDTGTDGSTDDGPPPDKTCRDGIGCIFACVAEYPPDPTPEDPTPQDWFLGCLINCSKDLVAEEALAYIRLVSCVSGRCYAEMDCYAPGDEPMDPDPDQDAICSACLGSGLMDPEPPGCVEEAAACK